MAISREEFITTGNAKAHRAEDAALDGRFWLEPLSEDDAKPTAVHGIVVPWGEALREVWAPMKTRDRQNDRIYENRALKRGGKYFPGMKALAAAGFDTARLFVTTSIVDTFVARISKRKTMPMFVVDDGDWYVKQKAQDTRRWLHGKLMEAEYDELRPLIIRDACARGDGVLYVDDSDDDILMERVHRWELLIDPYEADQGANAVRTMTRARLISKDALKARFASRLDEDERKAMEAAIDRIPTSKPEPGDSSADLADRTKLGTRDVVWFYESWHLPSRTFKRDEESDGRFAACAEGLTLCYREWKSPRFPFERLTRHAPMEGFWGRGDVEMLRGQQAELNKMIGDVSQNVAVTGKGVLMAPSAMDMPVESMTGHRPFKLSIPGPMAQGPQFTHFPPVGPATIDLIERKIRWMHELVGVGQWAAQAKSPLGNGVSGVAIDNMEDLQSDRHSVFEANHSHFGVGVAQRLLDAGHRVAARMRAENDNAPDVEEEYDGWEEVDEAEEVVADDTREAEPYDDDEDRPRRKRRTVKRTRKKRPEGKKFYATWMDKGRLERLAWDDCALEEDQYRLQIEPVSSMPSTRSGKYAHLTELKNLGALTPQHVAIAFEEPDTAATNRNINARANNVARLLRLVGDPRKPMPTPEEWHPLDMLLEETINFFNRAQDENAPPEVETRIRDFGGMVEMLIAQKNKPPAMPPGMPGPMPGAPGIPPPPMPGMPPVDPMAAPPIDPMMMPPGMAA